MKQNLALSGYAARFDSPDSSGDLFEPSAFERATVSPQRVRLLWQHQATNPIGRIKSLESARKGLWIEAEIHADVRLGREAISLVSSGALNGLSVGFRTLKSRFQNAGQIRRLTDVELWEVSLVTFPMHPEARIEQFGPVEQSGPNPDNDWAPVLAGIDRLTRRVSAAA